MTETPLKQCSRKEKCIHPEQQDGGWLPATKIYFHAAKNWKDGLHKLCRACKNKHGLEREHDHSEHPNTHKRCGRGRKCINPLGSILPATTEYFNRDKSLASGLTSWCKACVDANSDIWYENNRALANEQVIAYRARDPERWAAYQRQWTQEHRDNTNATAKRWREHHPEEAKEATRKWREQNSAHVLAQRKKPETRARKRQRHQERRSKNLTLFRQRELIQSHRRRARKKHAPGSHTAADIRLLIKSQTDKQGRLHCWWCGGVIENNCYHIDHKFPLSRGGSDAPENLCISCPHCNESKGSKLLQEWNGRLL